MNDVRFSTKSDSSLPMPIIRFDQHNELFYKFEGIHPLFPRADRVFIISQEMIDSVIRERYEDNRSRDALSMDSAMDSSGIFIILCGFSNSRSLPGSFELLPGDIVISRDLRGQGNPLEDCLFCVVHRYVLLSDK